MKTEYLEITAAAAGRKPSVKGVAYSGGKMRLINALMSRNLWPAVRDWLDATGYYDLFVAAQDFREGHPQFAAALTAARTRFSLPESEITAILAESAAD